MPRLTVCCGSVGPFVSKGLLLVFSTWTCWNHPLYCHSSAVCR